MDSNGICFRVNEAHLFLRQRACDSLSVLCLVKLLNLFLFLLNLLRGPHLSSSMLLEPLSRAKKHRGVKQHHTCV